MKTRIAAQALQRIEGDQPHVVVLDLGLPLLSGRDVRRELAAHLATKDIPIVVVTGADTSDLDPVEFPCVLRRIRGRSPIRFVLPMTTEEN